MKYVSNFTYMRDSCFTSGIGTYRMEHSEEIKTKSHIDKMRKVIEDDVGGDISIMMFYTLINK